MCPCSGQWRHRVHRQCKAEGRELIRISSDPLNRRAVGITESTVTCVTLPNRCALTLPSLYSFRHTRVFGY